MGFNGTNFEKHTVIIGWDSYSKAVADQLVEVGYKICHCYSRKKKALI